MTDPTPERRDFNSRERAQSICAVAAASSTRRIESHINICTQCQRVAGQIRLAEDAMRERCARICENIGKEIICPEECAAAIRKEPADG